MGEVNWYECSDMIGVGGYSSDMRGETKGALMVRKYRENAEGCRRVEWFFDVLDGMMIVASMAMMLAQEQTWRVRAGEVR